jgi:glycosyltransferase involved in cell wall biosynthesis
VRLVTRVHLLDYTYSMKVVYSIGGCTFANGGIGRTSYHAAAGIARHNNLQQVIVSDYRKSEIPDELITKVPSHIPGLRRIIGQRWANALGDYLHGYLASRVMQPADIFHGWAGMSLPAIEKAKKIGMKTVLDRASSHILTAKEILDDEYQRWGITSSKYINWAVNHELREYDLADYIFTPSPFARDSFITRGFSEGKVRLVRFGVNPPATELTLPEVETDGSFNVLFVGEVGFRKGILYALEAWEKVEMPNKGIFYVVGPILEEIKPFLGKYQTNPRIQIIGAAESINYYPKVQLFLFPSLEEGSALVTLEALAYGLPVITTHIAGSVVEDGVTGQIVGLRDTEAITRAIEELASNPELLTRMSNLAKNSVKKYTWEGYGDMVVNEYRNVFT